MDPTTPLLEAAELPVLGGGGGPADSPGGPAAAAEAAGAAPPPEAPPVEGQEAEGAGPEPLQFGQDELAQMLVEASTQGSRGALEQLLAQAAAEEEAAAAATPPEQGALPEWNPFDSDVVGQHMGAMFDRYHQEYVEPLLQELEQLRGTSDSYLADRGEKNANTIFDSLKPELGDFDRDQAIDRATRYAESGVNPNEAVLAAAREQAAFEKRIGDAAIARYTGQETNLEQAPIVPAAPGSTTGAEVVQIPTGPNRYKDQLKRSQERMGMTRTPGVTG